MSELKVVTAGDILRAGLGHMEDRAATYMGLMGEAAARERGNE